MKLFSGDHRTVLIAGAMVVTVAAVVTGCQPRDMNAENQARRAREVVVESMAAEGARILAARKAEEEAEVRDVLPEVKAALREAGHEPTRANFTYGGRATVPRVWCGIVWVPREGADSMQLRWVYGDSGARFVRTRALLSSDSVLPTAVRRTFEQCGRTGWSPAPLRPPVGAAVPPPAAAGPRAAPQRTR